MTEENFDLEEWYENEAVKRQCGMRSILARIENLEQEMELAADYNMIDEVSSRIKDFDSAYDKLVRKGLEVNKENLESLHDIAGIRIVTNFIDDVYEIRDAITRQPSMFVIEERDYIKNPKENGYRSLHLIVDMDIYFRTSNEKIRVEIQIRSKAQDYWASIEHLLKYKNPHPSPDIEQRLKNLAEILAQTDTDSQFAWNFNAEEAVGKEID